MFQYLILPNIWQYSIIRSGSAVIKMDKNQELLDETLTHLGQAIEMIDMLSIACSTMEQAEIIGPLEIMKRDFQTLYFKINQHLYEDH